MSQAMSLVFISYARKDIVAAKNLYNVLTGAGVNAWIDVEKLLAGQKWEAEIRKALSQASHFVALLSNNSISKRGYVQNELRQAIKILSEIPEGEIFLIPARLENCEIPYEDLRSLHWVDLFPSFTEGVAKIIRSIGASSRGVADDAQVQVVTSFIDVIGVKWIGGGAFASLETETDSSERPNAPVGQLHRGDEFFIARKSLPLATMLKDPKPDEIASMWGTACALSFHLVLNPLAPWAIVSAPFIIVKSYRPLPKYRPAYPLPAQNGHIYYVEIDDPQICGNSRFESKYLVHVRRETKEYGWRYHSEITTLSTIRLIPDVPEYFIVRVNAITPGIYEFDVCVEVITSGRDGNIAIKNGCVFLFESRS